MEQSNIFTSAWFSSAQSLFITKYPVNFCHKIRKIQIVGETELYEEKV